MTKTAESKWRALVQAQSRSGMSVREFAAQRGIPSATFYWWRSRLRRGARDGDLVPVVVQPAVEAAGIADPGFELHVGEVLTVRIPRGFDEVELRRLVQALRC